MKKVALLAVSLAACAPCAAVEIRCDTPGVAQLIIPDLFAHNAGAQKLDLHVASIKINRVEEDGAACFVTVFTNHGYELNYRFVYADGSASLDMVP